MSTTDDNISKLTNFDTCYSPEQLHGQRYSSDARMNTLQEAMVWDKEMRRV
jgi:hypothetical protein